MVVADEVLVTVRFRGSQKSKSWCCCGSDVTEDGYGDGEGERDGHDAAERSSLALLISEVGWMNTGVIGGDPQRGHSFPARISE